MRPGSDDHGPRLDGRSACELHFVRPLLAAEHGRGASDRDLGSELLRLRDRTASESLTGDPGREAQVVLDLRAGASLATGGVRLEHQDVESFRGAIDRRGQACRSGANHD